MRRAGTWPGMRHVGPGVVARPFARLAGDNGGAFVVDAEMQARRVELARRERVQLATELGPRTVPVGVITLDGLREIETAIEVRDAARELRVAVGDRLALGLVAVEQPGPAPALADGRELPAEIGGIVDRGVVALARGRGEQ